MAPLNLSRNRLGLSTGILFSVLGTAVLIIAFVVQWATGDNSEKIDKAVGTGAAALAGQAQTMILVTPTPLPVYAVQNNVAGGLPAFEVQLPNLAEAAPPPQPVTLVGSEYAEDLVKFTFGVSDFVSFGGLVWNCSFITEDYRYQPVGTSAQTPAVGQDAIDIARWDAMVFRSQVQIKEACQ